MHFLEDQKYNNLDVMFCIMYTGTIGLYARCSTVKKNCIVYFFLCFLFF